MRGSTALLAAALILPGCASGGGSSILTPQMPSRTTSPVTPTTAPGMPVAGTSIVHVRATLPAGAPALSSLTLINSVASVKLGADGTFQIPVYTAGQQFAELANAQGQAVAVGFVGSQSPTIDATSSAKTLIFFAAAFYQIPSPYRAQLVDGIAAAPGFGSVVSAVSSAIVKGGIASAAGAPVSATALDTFVTAFYAPASQNQAARVAKAFVKRPQDVAVSPSDAVSGIQTINDFPNGVHFQNGYRRLATAFFDEVSYTDSSNITHPKAVTNVVPPLQIPAVNGLGNVVGSLITAVNVFNGGDGVYTPVSTGSVPLALEPSSIKTNYNVTVVGAGLPVGATLTDEQTSAEHKLVAQQLVQDYLVPIVCTILLPVADTRIDVLLKAEGANAAFTDLVNEIAAVPQIIVLMNAGNVGDALTLAFNTVFGSNQLQAEVVAIAESAAVLAGGSAEQIAAYKAGSNLLKALNILSGALVLADVSAVKSDVLNSHTGDVFNVTVTPETITLTPTTASVADNGTQNFTVNVLADTSQDNVPLAYAWTNTATHGHLTDGIPGHLDNFTSTKNVVTYTANSTGAGTDAIAVTASIIKSPGNPASVVGRRTVTVTVTATPTTPVNGYSVTLTPSPCQQFPSNATTQIFTAVAAGPTLPPGYTLQYGWAFDYDFTNVIAPPTYTTETAVGNQVIVGLQPTASVTSPNLSTTTGLTGVGGGMGVYLYAQGGNNAPYYGETIPLNGPDGKQAAAVTSLAAGSVTCASLMGDVKSKIHAVVHKYANGSAVSH